MLTLKVQRANGDFEFYESSALSYYKEDRLIYIPLSATSPVLNSGDIAYVSNESGKTVHVFKDVNADLADS